MKSLLAAIDLKAGDADWHKWLVERSAQLAACTKARVSVLYVIDKKADKDKTDTYRDQLQALLEKLDRAIQGEAVVLAGSPAEALVEQSSFYDLVMVGPGAPGMLEFLIKGTMASRVIRESRSPVFVPRMERFIRVHDPQVFIGVDVRKAERDTKAVWMVREAGKWAHYLKGSLDLVSGGDPSGGDSVENLQSLANKLMDDAGVRDEVRGKTHINVPDLIAFTKDYDLAVVGNRDAYNFGSVANRIVTRAMCDVLVLPTATVTL